MAFIRVEHLTKTYEEEGVVTHALRDVSFTIDSGEFVAIRGPSGSGKSTLLHMLGLLDRPTSGQYVLEERNTESLSDEELAHIRNEKIGFVFQAFNLLPRTTVVDNVILPLQYSSFPHRQYRERAEKALTQVRMAHRLQYLSSQLSGGEKQRVAIARAIVCAPRLILADEPTGNLDSATGQIVMQTIDELHRQGHTVILITHETPTAQFAQRTIQLKDGMMVSDEQAGAHTHSSYTK
jgi:putative ABC transport system ATP-binding protein